MAFRNQQQITVKAAKRIYEIKCIDCGNVFHTRVHPKDEGRICLKMNEKKNMWTNNGEMYPSSRSASVSISFLKCHDIICVWYIHVLVTITSIGRWIQGDTTSCATLRFLI